jgi:hypothetical protein
MGEPVAPQEHIVAKPITTHTTKTTSHKGEIVKHDISESETVHKGVYGDMSLTVEAGRTINLGDYNSAKIGVTLTVPCFKDALNDTYEWASEWVNSQIEKEIKDAQGH